MPNETTNQDNAKTSLSRSESSNGGHTKSSARDLQEVQSSANDLAGDLKPGCGRLIFNSPEEKADHQHLMEDWGENPKEYANFAWEDSFSDDIVFPEDDGVRDPNRIYPTKRPYNPVVMGIVSAFCLCGLSQIILGQIFKGFVIMAVGMVFLVVTGWLGAPVVWAFCGIDAYKIATKLKRGQSVGKWEFF